MEELIVQDENTGAIMKILATRDQIARATSNPAYLNALINPPDKAAQNNNNNDPLYIDPPAKVDTNDAVQLVDTQENLIDTSGPSVPDLTESSDIDQLLLENKLLLESNKFRHSEQQNSNDENVNSPSLFIWREQTIFLLLSLYEQHEEEFLVSRQLKVFNKIATQINEKDPSYNVNGYQCQTKFNNLKKRYKKILDHNGKSGNDRANWPYFDRMQELFGATGWANPVATASEEGPSKEEEKPLPKKQKRKNPTICEQKKYFYEQKLLLKKEQYKTRSEQKERHHKEKLELKKEKLRMEKEKLEILKSIAN